MNFKEESIHPTIYKLHHHQSIKDNDFDKYVFMGAIYNLKKSLFDKILKEGYGSLTNNEEKEINQVMPNYKSKIGKIYPNRTHFLPILIRGDDSINMIKYKITYMLSNLGKKEFIGMYQQHLWIKNRNITYEKYINFVNYLFENDEQINLEHLVNRLMIITGLTSFEELVKYSESLSGQKTSIFKNYYFTYQAIMESTEIKKLIQNSSVILGREYIRTTGNKTFSRYIVANPFSTINHLSDKIVMDDSSDYNSMTLDYFNLIDDNIINLVDYQTFNNNYTKTSNKVLMANTYWNDQASNIKISELEKQYNEAETLLNPIKKFDNNITQIIVNKENQNNDIIWSPYLIKDLVIQYGSPTFQPVLNLEKIFNEFQTTKVFPFVKMVYGDDTTKYKINKKFLHKHNFKLKMILSWRMDRFINHIEYPKNKRFIVVKITPLEEKMKRKTLEKYLSVVIYENSFMLVDYHIDTPIDLKEAKEYLTQVNKLIFMIRKITHIQEPKFIESDLIFHTRSTKDIIRTKIASISLQSKVQFKNNKELPLNDFSEIMENFYPYFYTFLRNSSIKFIYKKIDHFDSLKSIQNFLNKIVEKDRKQIYQYPKKFVELIENIFLIDKTRAEDTFEKIQSLENIETAKYHFLYGPDISLFKDKNQYLIEIDNLQDFNKFTHLQKLIGLAFSYNFIKSKSKEKTSSHHSHTSIVRDINLDFNDDEGDRNFHFDDDLNQNMVFNYDGFGFGDEDMFLDIAKPDEKLKEQKSILGKGDKDKVGKEIIIDTNIEKKGLAMKNLKYTNYMAQMREKADPELYKVEEVGNLDDKEKKKGQGWKYSRICDSTQMRQPFIVDKEKLEEFDDPKAITGYLKYRGKYYICPRLWDYKAEKPISVEKFVENGLKSPYTGGEALPYDKRNKEVLGDKYTVITKRPTTSNYWSDSKLENGWPDLLKNTGAEGYPGFIKAKNHPRGLCIPCCFLKQPEDYDANSEHIQNFKKPVNYEQCQVDQETTITETKDTPDMRTETMCQNENYIKTDSAVLDHCRYGKLSEELDNLLRNYQDIFISSSTNSLFDYSNLFLRRGVISDKHSFLRSIAAIKGSVMSENYLSLDQLIDLITENLDPMLFMTLNQGSLVRYFKDTYNLPLNRARIRQFLNFIKKEEKLVEMMRMKDIVLENKEDFYELTSLQLRKVKKLYAIFSAWKNFLMYCRDPNVIKRHEFFLDLISRRLEWLFPSGANVAIIQKETNNLLCNPYFKNPTKPLIMLLVDSNNKFEPIFHIYKVTGKTMGVRGLIHVNRSVVVNDKMSAFLSKNVTHQELLRNTKQRLPVFQRLVTIHLENCREITNLSYGVNYDLLPTAYQVSVSLKYLDDSKFTIKAQVTNPYGAVTHIVTEGGAIIPTRPSGIIDEVPIYDLLEYFDLISHFELKDIIGTMKEINEQTWGEFKSMIAGYVVTDEKNDTVVALLTEADGIIPISPRPIKEIEKLEKLNHSLNLKKVVKKLYYDADFKIFDRQKQNDERVKVLDKIDNQIKLYEHFKYEISNILKNSRLQNQIADIMDKIDSPILTYEQKFQMIKPFLEKIAKELVRNNKKDDSNKKSQTLKRDNKYFIAVCRKLNKTKCQRHPYCDYHRQKGKGSKKKKDNEVSDCMIGLSKEEMSEFLENITEELLFNASFRKLFLQGLFIPTHFQSELLKIHDNEIFLTSENFYLLKNIYLTTEYNQDIDIYESYDIFSISEKDKERILKLEYREIEEVTEGEDSSLGVSGTVSSRSGLSKLPTAIRKKLQNIYATVFDKDGKFRSQYRAGPCIFPYVYGNTKQLLYECNKSKEEGQRCPVKIGSDRRPLVWGFCPADPHETRKDKEVQEIQGKATNKQGKIDKGFKSGKCLFPFRYHPSYDLSWECVSTKHGSSQKWCATSVKAGRDLLHTMPIAADKDDRIYQKKWDWTQLYKNLKTHEFNDEILRYNTRGYCPTPKNEDGEEGATDDVGLTIENFNLNKCHQTDSKGGYNKTILKDFAIRELDFDRNELEGKKKRDICDMIREKISSGTYHKEDMSLLSIYNKDPKQCEKGESGGGYYLGTLRKMASKYFGMNPNKAKNASKKDLCEYIIPILEHEIDVQKKQKGTQEAVSGNLSQYYQKNPYFCEEGPKKGGYTIRELKEIATKYFGISPSINKKDEICKMIRNALENENKKSKTRLRISTSRDTSEYDDEISETTFRDLISRSSRSGKSSRNKSRLLRGHRSHLKSLLRGRKLGRREGKEDEENIDISFGSFKQDGGKKENKKKRKIRYSSRKEHFKAGGSRKISLHYNKNTK